MNIYHKSGINLKKKKNDPLTNVINVGPRFYCLCACKLINYKFQ